MLFLLTVPLLERRYVSSIRTALSDPAATRRAEFAGSIQVLLFTHYRHVLSLVEEVLAPEQLTVHELVTAAPGQTR